MYPIPATKSLSLPEIADHWSREISPTRTAEEIEQFLARAWWMGEFKDIGGRTRLKALISFFKISKIDNLFWINGEQKPQRVWEYPDGSAKVLMLPVLQVPSNRPEEWTDDDCQLAYQSIAENWGDDIFQLVEPVIFTISLSQQDFSNWLNALGYNQPIFWGKLNVSSPEVSLIPATELISEASITRASRRRGPKPKIYIRVKAELIADIKGGKFTIDDLDTFTEESFAAEYGVSRDTFRRVKKSILSEIVEDNKLD